MDDKREKMFSENVRSILCFSAQPSYFFILEVLFSLLSHWRQVDESLFAIVSTQV